MISIYNLESDINVVVNIWLITSLQAHSFISSDYWKSKQEDMKNIYLPASETYIYKDDTTKEILGFISLVDDYLSAIFVKPGNQRKGIGTLLLNHAKAIRDELTLHVYLENSSSIDFYTKNGFTILDQQTDPNTGAQELKMKWSRKN